MCGIHAAISHDANPYKLTPNLERCLRNRGPDHLGTVSSSSSSLTLSLTSTVLALRGDHVARQPLVDEKNGSVLCWNGEAWKIRGRAIEGNDAEAVFSLLSAAGGADGVLGALRSVEGPFAFIYYDKPARRLYYGRDRLGRRSLLVKRGEQQFLLSSVAEAPVAGWEEVEADGCYAIEMDGVDAVSDLNPVRHDWSEDEALVSSIGVFNHSLPQEVIPVSLTLEAPSVKQLRERLTESIRLRVLNVPLPPQASPLDARVAVLFSGGLDCTVLARLASDLLPSGQAVDLINVAFENPRIAAQNPNLSPKELYELCPDRVTGRKSFAELKAVCPDRRWRFLTVNVPYVVALAHRAEVMDLIYPHNTEMDLSIAYALYFAARGEGVGQTSDDLTPPQPCSTTARVLLSGLGADELFGGYVRHATAFARGGYAGLVDELRLDISRLGRRNLGRDDRIMAHWSKEVRFPCLDESLVKWAVELPAWEKCDFGSEIEVGGEGGRDGTALEPGKKILRLLAQELGMVGVAAEKKRAIQFGARTAKMENGRVKGTDPLS